MSRVHERFLGVSCRRSVRSEGDLVERLVLTKAARSMLLGYLRVPSAFRGGLLFGQVVNGTLTVEWAAPGAYPMWQGSPLAVDDRYALGWADALAAVSPEVDWVGQWIVYPDAMQHAALEDWAWLEAARHAGVFYDQQVAVFAGWSGGRLALNGYVLRDEPERVEVENATEE